VVNRFLNDKHALLASGELSPLTAAKHRTATDLLVRHFGKGRLVSDLDATDFAELRKRMAAKWGPYRLADMIQQIRSIFNHAYKADLIPAPVKYGPGFDRPEKHVLRLHKARQGPKLFEAEEVRAMI